MLLWCVHAHKMFHVIKLIETIKRCLFYLKFIPFPCYSVFIRQFPWSVCYSGLQWYRKIFLFPELAILLYRIPSHPIFSYKKKTNPIWMMLMCACTSSLLCFPSRHEYKSNMRHDSIFLWHVLPKYYQIKKKAQTQKF
jgi:hypothetical protein